MKYLTEKTITWVAPMGEPDERGNRYITVKFADGDTGYIGKKDLDAAIGVKGLLQGAVDKVLEFTLEDTGKTNAAGGSRFKIKAFGEYQPAPYVPGVSQGSGNRSGGSSWYNSEAGVHFTQERTDRRTALMQAVQHDATQAGSIFEKADAFYEWLRKTSEPASSAYEGGGTDTALPVGSPVFQAGVGSETTSPVAPVGPVGGAAVAGDTQSAVSAADGGVGVGEGSCPPHDLDLDVAPKAMRYPCRKCSFWIKPTMAAEEVEEAR